METLVAYLDFSNLWSGMALVWSRLNGIIKKHSDGVVSSQDWQIRLSFVLVACTFVNILLIGLAWRVFGENVSTIFYNKPRSPARRLENLDGSMSKSMQELITKKTQ